ncbi:MAG: hypothetical protein U1E65_16425 [Myxococcota bacterium]
MRWTLLALLGLSACSGTAPQFFQVPGDPSQLLVIAESTNGPRVVASLSGAEIEKALRFTPQPGDQTLTVLPLSAAELNALSAEQDPSRQLQFAIDPGAICAIPNAATDTWVRRLPSGLTAYTADLGRRGPLVSQPSEAVPILAQVTVSVPLRADRCRALSEEVVEPYGTSVELLTPGDPLGPVHFRDGSMTANQLSALVAIAELDIDHVLAVSRGAVFKVDRGQPFQADPAHAFFLPYAGIKAGDWFGSRRLAIDPRNANHAVLVGDATDQPGRIWELALQPNLVLTATSVDAAFLEAVQYSKEGDLFIAGDQVLLVRRAGSPQFQRQTLGVEIDRILIEQGIIVLTSPGGKALIGDTASLNFRSVDIPAGFGNVDAMVPRYMGAELEILAGMTRGALMRVHDGLSRFTPLDLGLPAPAVLCGKVKTDCGYQSLVGAVRALIPLAQGYLELTQDCDGAVYMRPDDGCTRALLPVGAHELNVSPQQWFAGIKSAADRVVISGAGMRMAQIPTGLR